MTCCDVRPLFVVIHNMLGVTQMSIPSQTADVDGKEKHLCTIMESVESVILQLTPGDGPKTH